MESIKKVVQVTITKEIEIELTPEFFGGMTTDALLKEWRESLWHVDGIDDVIRHAAEMAATVGGGYSLDGLGLLDEHKTAGSEVPQTKFTIRDETVESEILEL